MNSILAFVAAMLSGMFRPNDDPALRGKDPHKGGGHVGTDRFGRRATRKAAITISKIERRQRKKQSIGDRRKATNRA